jgi:hypothetical protein
MILRYILAWVPMIAIGIANGVIRETTYGKHLSELRAHQVSTLIGICLFGVYVWGLTRFWRLESFGEAVAIGFIWLGLTIAFEFLFGRYVAGHSWNQLFRDYNLLAGRVWLVILIWITISPAVFYIMSG